MKIAVITGITGQDGAYLAELLLSKNYVVFGTYRRTSSVNFWRIEELGVANHPNLHLVEYDLTDLSASIRLLQETAAVEVYNLAAQSFVGVSFDQPIATAKITGLGPVNMLEAIRIVNPNIRFYQASSSEMFGKVQSIPQSENTPFYPRSPYGVAKLFAHWMTINYRESYDIFGCSGILFNHESPLRAREFVTRKITDGFAKIKLGMLNVLELGNMDAKRDWGYAKEYVEGMWRMLQADKPDTYVLATNRSITVRDFVMMAAKGAGYELTWEGNGESEVGVDRRSGKTLVRVNRKFYRPAEVDLLIGDPEKARVELGWEPKTTLERLCEMMVEADIRRNEKGFRSKVATVLITGIHGFTGYFLSQELLSAGYTVVGMSRDGSDMQSGNIVFQRDLLDRGGLAHVLAEINPNMVVHLAGISFVAHGDVDAIYRTNIIATRNLLEALVIGGCKPCSVLLASSANVYGNAAVEPIHESTPTAPANDYAVSKLAMEHMAQLWCDRLPITIVRPFNYTGVSQSQDFLLPKIVDHFKRRASYLELGNLDVVRDFSDVRSVARCYRLLLEAGMAGEVFNICSGYGYSLSDVLQIMREITDHDIEIRINPAFVRANEVRRLIGSRAKLELVIGAVPDISLRGHIKMDAG